MKGIRAHSRLNSTLCVIVIILLFMCRGTEDDNLVVAAGKQTDVLTEEEQRMYQSSFLVSNIDSEEPANEIIMNEKEEKGTISVISVKDEEENLFEEKDIQLNNLDNSIDSITEGIISGIEENLNQDILAIESDSSNISESVDVTGLKETSDIDGIAMYDKLLLKGVGWVSSGSAIGTEKIPTDAQLPTESNDARYEYITGKGYKAYTTSNMPEGYRTQSEASEKMKSVTLPVWKINSSGRRYSSSYTIKINEKLVKSVVCIFNEIYELEIKFPIKYMSGFGYRKVGGVGLVNSKLMSAHAFGTAIDINPGDYDNDYYLGQGNDLRDKDNPYCIPDEVIKIFEKYGWNWGGNFSICSDTMHFQYLGLEFLKYSVKEPFPIIETGVEPDEKALKNLQERLVKLKYLKKIYSKYNNKVEAAVIKFQKDNRLKADGRVTYSTWEKLINKTHYMKYTF